jgi:hypothetical protein
MHLIKNSGLFDIWFQKCPYFNDLFNCCPGVEDEGTFGRMASIGIVTLLPFFSLTRSQNFFRKCPLKLLSWAWGMRVRTILEE